MKTMGRIVMVVLAIGVGTYALSFLDFQIKGILQGKGELIKNLLYLSGFYTHVIGGGIALIVGSFQFFPKLRNQRLSLHRLLGRIYVIACVLSGIAGLGIAFFATGGYITKCRISSISHHLVIYYFKGLPHDQTKESNGA